MSGRREQNALHERDARGVHRFTLNTPLKFNVLSEAMLTALQQGLDAVAADEQARVVVIGAAGKAFCAGHDLKQMRSKPEHDYYRDLFSRCSRVMQGVLALPVPVIARVQGLATAAGCQLVATCDMAVATESTRFAVSGINVGLFCSTPMVALTRNVPRKQAFEMLTTGEFLPAPGAPAAVAESQESSVLIRLSPRSAHPSTVHSDRAPGSPARSPPPLSRWP